jgi:hypothetical protein
LGGLLNLLPDDATLRTRVADLSAAGKDGLAQARELLAYVSENYRVESRVIRNRRAHLAATLPTRALDERFSYAPGERELAVLDELLEYAAALGAAEDAQLAGEYRRLLLHAASSSPWALSRLLTSRATRLAESTPAPPSTFADLTSPAAPRDERERIAQLIDHIAPLEGEAQLVRELLRTVERWRDRVDGDFTRAQRRGPLRAPADERLLEALRAVLDAQEARPPEKVLLFSSWPETLAALREPLQRLFGNGAVAEFHAGLDAEQLQAAADAFQSRPECQILLCDELGGEGRNFQMAGRIIHLDLPWSPARLEQRIGRVDRLGGAGRVLSVVPYARDTHEHDLFRIWQDAFQLFTQSLSGLEIALEDVQDELQAALAESPREGLAELFIRIERRVERLRRAVEAERYFEEGALNARRRREFASLSDRYRDGEELRRVVTQWANLAGLRNHTDDSGICVFRPRDFNAASMANARFVDPPDMREALRRARRRNDQTIRGTFNREVAVRREDLVFYAPGDDPWFDAIVRNAREADRGRCCAILRSDARVRTPARLLELRYALQVDLRPLYVAGGDPSQLLRAGGYLRFWWHTLILTEDGEPLGRHDPLRAVLASPFDNARDTHLGQRGGQPAPLEGFRAAYPADSWEPLVDHLQRAAQTLMAEEFDFLEDEAELAREEFGQRALAWRAVQRWLARELGQPADEAAVAAYDAASDALAAGIARPIVALQSACFWVLQPQGAAL